jgi:hypothetical protein
MSLMETKSRLIGLVVEWGEMCWFGFAPGPDRAFPKEGSTPSPANSFFPVFNLVSCKGLFKDGFTQVLREF